MSEDVRESFHAHAMTKYRLVIGRRYTPFAMAQFWPMGLKVLVLDESGRPNWVPMPLFRVVDDRLTPAWHFGVAELADAPSVTAVWGYREMVSDPTHFEALIERKLHAWETFIDVASASHDLEAHEREAVEIGREQNREYRRRHF